MTTLKQWCWPWTWKARDTLVWDSVSQLDVRTAILHCCSPATLQQPALWPTWLTPPAQQKGGLRSALHLIMRKKQGNPPWLHTLTGTAHAHQQYLTISCSCTANGGRVCWSKDVHLECLLHVTWHGPQEFSTRVYHKVMQMPRTLSILAEPCHGMRSHRRGPCCFRYASM